MNTISTWINITIAIAIATTIDITTVSLLLLATVVVPNVSSFVTISPTTTRSFTFKETCVFPYSSKVLRQRNSRDLCHLVYHRNLLLATRATGESTDAGAGGGGGGQSMSSNNSNDSNKNSNTSMSNSKKKKMSRPERKALERQKKKRSSNYNNNNNNNSQVSQRQYHLHSTKVSTLCKSKSTAEDVITAIKRAQNKHDISDIRNIAKFLLHEVDVSFAYGFRGSLLARLAVAALHMSEHESARRAIDVRKLEHHSSMLPMESAAIIRGLLRVHNVTDAIHILEEELPLPVEVSSK